ncbi:MAG TPA: cobalt-precorrin-6A reductase [Stellaceae bacterium]|nr:cobalt-precorrin-6A reductase [Stellaceae bacterium]
MSSPERRAHLLILGGTGEAAALAAAALARYGDQLLVTSSLAGTTRAPTPLPGCVRVGGFGGAAGLADYLTAAAVEMVIDATHPFAARISAHAQQACVALGVPRLVLRRPEWTRHPGDRWIEVESAAAAAARLPALGQRAWLTIGARELDAFAELSGIHFLIRTIDPPAHPPPLASYEIIAGRGPFTLASERHILERHAIDVLVARASGGAATEAKLVAARELGLPVLMLRRPPAPCGPSVTSVEDALAWLAGELARARTGRKSR